MGPNKGHNAAGAAGTHEAPAAPVVVYEDEWLLAADKPAGLIVHGDGTGTATLTDAVRAHLEREGRDEAAAQLQAVQRLDADTTGLVLFCLDKAVQPRLDALVASHDGIEKRYLAIVRGEVPEGLSVIDAALARDRHDARRMRVDARVGKPSRTRVRVLDVAGPRRARLSLLELTLETGRKHQIRVHLASRGYPILGDALYGVPADRSGRAPLMLHAASEALAHPVTGKRLELAVPYPERYSVYFPR